MNFTIANHLRQTHLLVIPARMGECTLSYIKRPYTGFGLVNGQGGNGGGAPHPPRPTH